ncbi:hypothetical protein PHMEG_00035431 [Phytophthora megakarya]|uniref:Uncharacterized protein n=1 Tax=Phytophthora megakarya TaxID=4795 RepID=A0A225UNS0_9STRA|nr:hypothetical protein PHMEG_00035431 [Phytophthora megakarya]
MDEYFQMAMNRFLKEQNLVTMQPPHLGTQDVEMESVSTPDLDSWEYDPDHLGIPSSSGHTSGRAAVASAAIGSGNSSSLIQRTKWADLLESFQTQYCGLGMLVAWRSEETPLDYLYQLNVAALRAKLKIKDGNTKARREHVDHYVETLGDPELADRLTLL